MIRMFFLLAVVAVLCTLASYCQASSEDILITSFEQFKAVYHKHYHSAAEERIRRDNFYRSLRWIQQHQHHHQTRRTDDVQFAINGLADLSNEEFRGMNLTSFRDETYYAGSVAPSRFKPDNDLPEQFDWRDQVDFGPADHQLGCGACWAFSAVASIEANFAIHRNRSIRLSSQELVDCARVSVDPDFRNHGCRGGFPTDAFKYAAKFGLAERDEYPYLALDNHSCQREEKEPAGARNHRLRYHVNGYHRLNYQVSDEEIMTVVRRFGPVAGTLYAHHDGFKHYRSGVMRDLFPNSVKITHAVAIVGWGSVNQTTAVANGDNNDDVDLTSKPLIDYWIVRNSWGEEWGEQGYGRIERHHNLMGLNNFVSFPVVKATPPEHDHHPRPPPKHDE